MPISVDNTPNPNALKFTVGAPVGGPSTYVAGGDVDDPLAADLIGIDGVASIFLTADFITLSKTADASWDEIAPRAVSILEARFGT